MSQFNEAEDLPLGLMMQLGQDMDAMNYFAALSDEQKEYLVSYIRGAESGSDARARVEQVMNQLHNHQGGDLGMNLT